MMAQNPYDYDTASLRIMTARITFLRSLVTDAEARSHIDSFI